MPDAHLVVKAPLSVAISAGVRCYPDYRVSPSDAARKAEEATDALKRDHRDVYAEGVRDALLWLLGLARTEPEVS